MTIFRRAMINTRTVTTFAIGVVLVAAATVFAQTGNFSRLRLSNATTINSGSGSPESSLAAPIGSIFLRTDTGGIYSKLSGTSTTGWGLAPGSNGYAAIRKTASESVTSSTTLQNDDALLFAVGANQVWTLDLVLFVDGATTGDIKLGVTVPASTTYQIGGLGNIVAASGIDSDEHNATLTTGTISFGTAGTGTTTMIIARGTLATSSTAGSVTLQWAQDTSDATATRVLANSFLRAWQIP